MLTGKFESLGGEEGRWYEGVGRKVQWRFGVGKRVAELSFELFVAAVDFVSLLWRS